MVWTVPSPSITTPAQSRNNMLLADRSQAATAAQELQTDAGQYEFDEQQRNDGARWMAGAGKYGLDESTKDPARAMELGQKIFTEGARRGYGPADQMPPMNTPEEAMAAMQRLYDDGMTGLGGGQQQNPDYMNTDIPSDVRSAIWLKEQTPEMQSIFAQAKRQQPGLSLKEINMPDGTTQMVPWDPQTATAFDWNGQPLNTPAPSAPGRMTGGQPSMTSQPGGPVTPTGFGVSADPVDLAARKKDAELEVVKEAGGDKRGAAALTGINKVFNVQGAISNALGLTDNWSAGFGSFLKGIPKSDALALDAALTTIKANLGFEALQEMRRNSPTGGALGQVAVQELVALQATVANLDQAQDPENLKENINVIGMQYDRWLNAYEIALITDGTPEQYQQYWDMLPSGFEALTPDGKRRKKP